jgi:chromosome partitioning protein
VEVERREFRLKEALDSVASRYDHVLVDCPPSLGLLTVNALVAADAVLVPLQCEYYAMEGLGRLLDTIERVRRAFNPKLGLEGILFCMYDGRTNLTRQVAEEVRSHFPSRVFETVIPRNVRLGESPSFGKPVILYDIQSKGCQSYLRLAREYLDRAVGATA